MSEIKKRRVNSRRRLAKSVLGQFTLDRADEIDNRWREMISHRTSAALRAKIKRGERVGGVPYGYCANDRGTAWVPVPEELATFERMRQERERGETFRAIADRLNRDGVPTKNGGYWYASTVQQILLRSRRRAA